MKIYSDKIIAAVILAGGRGTRMGGNYKQFVAINGVPVFFYSLREFLKCSFIHTIVIVVPKEKLAYARKVINKKFKDTRIELVVGGSTRRQSSYYALRHLQDSQKKIDFVVFHDAARPLVSTQMIRAVIKEGVRIGAATMAIQAIDTVGFSKDGFLVSIPSKEKLYYVYLPNCFRFDWIWNAHHHKKNSLKSLANAENTALLANIGEKIKIIDSFYPNLKLTYKPDIKTIKAFLR